jgi:hypothetical protein
MDKQQQKSLKRTDQSQRTTKKELVIGSVIATLIAITPYLFELHESIPEEPVWDTFLFTYESPYFGDVNYVGWIFTGKAIPLFLLLIWFFTNRHWWYHVLIIPIAMYIYQIVGFFNDDYGYYDEFGFLYLIPIMAVVIPSIYLIRAQMFNKINEANKTIEELEEEFKIKPKSLLSRISDYF